MSLKIIRNDITKMNTQAIVNTANEKVCVGTGCDSVVYEAAGFEKLLAYRKENIGEVEEGKAFITPGFELEAEYIIHAVSPHFIDGESGEEEKLRSCYKESLRLAKENEIKSISFPVISTGGLGYPKEEGLRIAIDEINAFLLQNEMDVYLVVFDNKTTHLGFNLDKDLEEYIDDNYVDEKFEEEYFLNECSATHNNKRRGQDVYPMSTVAPRFLGNFSVNSSKVFKEDIEDYEEDIEDYRIRKEAEVSYDVSKLEERMKHLEDSFSEYLMYLIEEKNLKNADVYKAALVDKKTFSKIKNNPDYHPTKLTAMCLCIGAHLNYDETVDLLSRAGYALSPSDKTDIIFSFFIENKIYDMIELDIKLEEYGLQCLIP